MFCGKCGTKNVEHAEFCAGCGAKLHGSQSQNSVSSATMGTDDKNRKVGIIAVAIVAVIALMVVIFAFGGRSYKATVKKFVNASFEADAEAIINLIPKGIIDYTLEEEGYDSDELDEFIDEGNEELKEQMDALDNYLGENWEVSYEIISIEDLRKSDLNDLKENYEDVDVKVSDAKTIEVELAIKAEETETNNSMEISVIKVGRSWYIDILSMGNLF